MAIGEKRTKKGFNGSDLFFILVIAALIVAVIFFRGNIQKSNGSSESEPVNIEYTIEFKKLENSVTGYIKAGDSIRDPDNKQFIGTVISVQIDEYSEIAYNFDDGVAVMAENPDYSNMLVTIKATAMHTETGYYINGTRFLVGKQNNIWSSGFVGTGYCISIAETK